MNMENRFLFILTFHWVYSSEINNEEQIRSLEKEKGELLLQIQKGISDSIKTLRNDNDTEAILGVKYLTDLGKQIMYLNDTGDSTNTNAQQVKRNFKDARRKPKLDLEDIAHLFNTKSFDKKNMRKENKIVLEKKLQDWMKQREEEKAKIKHYKDRIKSQLGGAEKEKCPRFGFRRSERSKMFKYDRSQNNNRKVKYPCCRKCCKKSYLGCL